MQMYDVGQVLFVVLRKKQKIIPVQVIEQIVRRSLDGETIQYQVRVPSYDDPMSLESLGDDVYSNINDVKDVLKQNASSVVDSMAEAAMSLVAVHFKNKVSSSPIENIENEKATVDLGGGKKAKIDISSLKKLHL